MEFRIVPNARKNEVVGIHGEAIKIRLRAPAVDNKANQSLVKFLSKQLGISRSEIRIVRGEHNRSKVVAFDDCNEKDLRSLLLAPAKK